LPSQALIEIRVIYFFKHTGNGYYGPKSASP